MGKGLDRARKQPGFSVKEVLFRLKCRIGNTSGAKSAGLDNGGRANGSSPDTRKEGCYSSKKKKRE